MEAFLFVCDTLPVFDVADGLAWARAREKRIVASAFLADGARVWVPLEFSLEANALHEI
jgi:hypothetical protein